MRNTLNFTGRRTLSYAGEEPECRVVRERVDGMRFRVKVTLHKRVGEHLPERTMIWCEAWYRNQFQRMPIGSNVEPPDEFVTEFDRVPSDVARVRVKLVDESGMILYQTPTISPTAQDDGSDGTSLIGIREIPAMDTPWRVEVQSGERPVLLVHGELGLRERLLADPAIQQLVLPAAIRDVGLRYLMLDSDERDQEPWCRRFFQFADLICGEQVEAPPSPAEGGDFESVDQWLDRFTGAFCTRHGLLNKVEDK